MTYGNTARDLTGVSDIWRLEILLRHGGIWTDWDAIWLKPLTDELRSFEAVIGPDGFDGLPQAVNNGIMLARKNAEFLHRFQKAHRYFRAACADSKLCNPAWGNPLDRLLRFHECLNAPYKVFECYPWTLHIEPRLQVECWNRKCYPPWYEPGNRTNQHVDWNGGDTFVQHVVDDQPEYESFSHLCKQIALFDGGGAVNFMIQNAAKILRVAEVTLDEIASL